MADSQVYTPDGIQYYNIHHGSILSDLFTNGDIYDNDSYASYADWKIEKTPKINPKKLEFNINKPEIYLKAIEFNINVNNDEIDDMNDKEAVHPNDGLVDDNNNNIEDHEAQQEQIDRHNNFNTLVENKLQPSPQLEDQNETNDWKTTNKHEDELVIAYNNNTSSKTLYPKISYALYIGPNDRGTGHLIFKLSTKQVLTIPKYKPVPMPEDLIKAINKMDTYTNKI